MAAHAGMLSAVGMVGVITASCSAPWPASPWRDGRGELWPVSHHGACGHGCLWAVQTFGWLGRRLDIVGGETVVRMPGIAGRVEERAVLSAAIERAVDGRPGAVFVHGEAGVGKTRLVRAVCDGAASNGAEVLWGRCVRFGAVDAPYVALVGAMEGWLESAEPSERSAVLAAVPGASELLPSLGGRASRSMVRLLSVVDGLVGGVVVV